MNQTETYSQKYYRENKDKRRANYDQWAAKNQGHIATKKREWYQKNKERICKKRREWRADNKEHVATTKKRYQIKLMNDPIRKAQYHKRCNEYANTHLPTRLRRALHGRITRLLKFAKTNKTCGTTKLLGCSIKKFKEHIENQFKDTMTWDNWGRTGWHIDHVKPCKDFDLTKRSNQLECFNYQNLQPLWYTDNLAKRFK